MNRDQFNQLKADFLAAKNGNCSDPDVWMDLAMRYLDVCANMNYAYCVRRAEECREAARRNLVAAVVEDC